MYVCAVLPSSVVSSAPLYPPFHCFYLGISYFLSISPLFSRVQRIGKSYFNEEDLRRDSNKKRDLVQVWEGFFQTIRIAQVRRDCNRAYICM